MAELLTDSSQPVSNWGMGDMLHALFKHKWKIVFGAVVGIITGTVVYLRFQPLYESNAKLLVRYVLDRATIDSEAGSAPRMGENIIGAEVEILTSWDLAVDVVEAIGVKRLLPGAPAGSKTDAAGTITSGLRVYANPQSNIISVNYSNADPDLASLVLSELVNRYFNKHLEVHRSAGAFDFVTQQTDQVRARLNETEDSLKALRAKAGIITLADSYGALSASLARADDQLHNAEEELAEQRTRVRLMEEAGTGAAAAKAPAATGPTAAELSTYRALVGRLEGLRQGDFELLARYTEDNPLVKVHRAQIANLEKQRLEMETKFPDLTSIKEGTSAPTLISEKAKVAALEGRVEALKARLMNVRSRVKELSEVGTQIADLERNRDLLVQSYNYFKSTLEKARIDEALDPSKIPNISAVQRPTPPHRVYGKRDKITLAVAGSGLGLIVGLVLLSELILNQTVKRPFELEKRLGAPLLVSIPYNPKGAKRRRLLAKKAKDANGKNGNGQLASWEVDHFIRPYAVAIRDRLGLYFELNRMTHKPKLVGVTGFKEGGGTSTLAAGLAAALSEMGDGKVLLVDVNLGPHEVHPFFKGRPAISLNAALQANGEENEPAAENLYLAMVSPPSDGPAQLGLKKFFDMMPNLKASDFDYVIFDMPPVSQTSPTVGMAGFMDKVLLVVEAEKNNRDAVKRGFEALTTQRDNVSLIFNKARSYSPKWLNGDS